MVRDEQVVVFLFTLFAGGHLRFFPNNFSKAKDAFSTGLHVL
jgi:hypothetical protein